LHHYPVLQASLVFMHSFKIYKTAWIKIIAIHFSSLPCIFPPSQKKEEEEEGGTEHYQLIT